MREDRFCEGGGNTCDDCVGSCGIEEFEIFVAGFEHSAEGFNGEYASPKRYPDWLSLRNQLRDDYRKWQATGDVPA